MMCDNVILELEKFWQISYYRYYQLLPHYQILDVI